MAYDILFSGNAELRQRAEKLGIEPLVLDEDVAVVESPQAVKERPCLLVLGGTDDRGLLESDVDGVLLTREKGRDHLHFRKGGLDQVKAKILAKERKALVLSFAAVKNAQHKQKLLGRMIQNARIAQRFGVPVVLASCARTPDELVAPHDLAAFFRSMGIPGRICDRSAQTFSAWVGRAQRRASDEYVAEGVTRRKRD